MIKMTIKMIEDKLLSQGYRKDEDGFFYYPPANDFYTHFKILSTNGRWAIIKFQHDGALYSCHFNCGYTHPAYFLDLQKDAGMQYDESQEFNYCPCCGKEMNIRANREENRGKAVHKKIMKKKKIRKENDRVDKGMLKGVMFWESVNGFEESKRKSDKIAEIARKMAR